MKFHPKKFICCLLAGGLFCWAPAIFAGPRGKGIEYGQNSPSFEFLKLKKNKKQTRILSEKYLSTDQIPTVSIYREVPVEDVYGEPSPEYGSQPPPSLRAFLNQLEAEKAKEAERLSAVTMDNKDQGEQGHSDSSGQETGLEHADTVAGSGETNLDGDGSMPLKPNDPEALARFFGTTDPREGGPIFPKPSKFGSSVDRFFMYFPLNSDEGTGSEPGMIMLPINSEAIFQPPGSSNMRSSATLREGT